MAEWIQEIGGIGVLLVAAVAAVRSWWHSNKARELLDELIEDVGEELRKDVAEAIAEGASQVVIQLKQELQRELDKRGMQVKQ